MNISPTFVQLGRSMVAIIWLVAFLCCSQAQAKAFLPPNPDGKPDEVLAAIHNAGDEYKTYTLGSSHSQIDAQEISVAVVNDMKKFQVFKIEGGHGIMASETLDPSDREKATQTILRSATEYLQSNFHVSDTSRYRILILVYGGNSMYFDNNQRPWGEMDIRILLLDTTAKAVLWYTGKAWGLGNDLGSAATFGASSVNKQLDILLGEKKS
jgi:hypothetical protein